MSKSQARRALARAGNRIRVYACRWCAAFHVTSEAEPGDRQPWSRGGRS